MKKLSKKNPNDKPDDEEEISGYMTFEEMRHINFLPENYDYSKLLTDEKIARLFKISKDTYNQEVSNKLKSVAIGLDNTLNEIKNCNMSGIAKSAFDSSYEPQKLTMTTPSKDDIKEFVDLADAIIKDFDLHVLACDCEKPKGLDLSLLLLRDNNIDPSHSMKIKK